MKIEEIVTKLKDMGPDAEVVIGQDINGKYYFAMNTGWVVEENEYDGYAAYGDTIEEAANIYAEHCKGKSFQFEVEDKEPYEVQFTF